MVYKRYILTVLILIVLAPSCGDDTATQPTDKAYGVNGLLFYNSDDNSSVAYFELTEDGEPLTNAILKVKSFTVPHTGGGIYSLTNPVLHLAPGSSHSVTITVSDEEILSEAYMLPDTFSVDVMIPANNIYEYTGPSVSVTWTGSASSQGYILTVVKPDSAAAAPDIAEFVTTGTTAATVPDGAFRKADGTDDPLPGTYRIYVLSYRETFNSWPGLFFPLTMQLPTGNVDGHDISGTIGVGTLSKSDTLVARINPQ